MTLRRIFRSGLLLLSGNALGFAFLLCRNLLVARLVTVEDYGIAAAFAIIVAMIEVMSQIGLQQLIVQRADGDDERVQAGIQCLHFARAVVAAGVMVAIGPAVADFMNLERVAWAFQLLAVVPLLRGLMHFDVFRLQRAGNFRPFIVSFTIPAMVSALSVWPLYLLTPDYRVMLHAILIEAVFAMAVSHLVADRRYRFAVDMGLARDALKFGWPLFINAIFLFVVMQGEKMVVGRELGVAALALFAMGFTLTLTPTLILARSLSSMFLPRLSALKAETDRFRALALSVFQLNLANGLLVAVGVFLVGEIVVEAVLGEKYRSLAALLPLFAVLHAIRVFKSGPAVIALSKASSVNSMVGNLGRIFVFPAFWWFAAAGTEVSKLLFIAIAGEIVGFLLSLAMLSRLIRLRSRRLMLSLASAAAILIAVTVGTLDDLGYLAAGWSPAPVVAAFCVLFLLSMADLRALARKMMRRG